MSLREYVGGVRVLIRGDEPDIAPHGYIDQHHGGGIYTVEPCGCAGDDTPIRAVESGVPNPDGLPVITGQHGDGDDEPCDDEAEEI